MGILIFCFIVFVVPIIVITLFVKFNMKLPKGLMFGDYIVGETEREFNQRQERKQERKERDKIVRQQIRQEIRDGEIRQRELKKARNSYNFMGLRNNK